MSLIHCFVMKHTGLMRNPVCFIIMGENQIKEIIHAAYCSVFFIDESQRVTMDDIGSVEEIEKWARRKKTPKFIILNWNHSSDATDPMDILPGWMMCWISERQPIMIWKVLIMISGSVIHPMK